MPSGRGRLPPVLLRTLTADSVSSLTDDRRPTDASVFAAFTAVSVDENVRGVDGVASGLALGHGERDLGGAGAVLGRARRARRRHDVRADLSLPPFDGVRSANVTLPVEQRRDESGSGGTGVDRRWNPRRRRRGGRSVSGCGGGGVA